MSPPIVVRRWRLKVCWIWVGDPPPTYTVEVITPPRAAVTAGPASLPPAARPALAAPAELARGDHDAAGPAWWCHVCMRPVPASEVPTHQHDR
jgi:hypothetical protein